MNYFKFWIFSICGASAITALFKFLLSKSSVSKTLNTFFSLFILFYTVIPMQNFFTNKFTFSSDKIGESDISFNEFYEDGYKNIVEKSIQNACLKLSVKVLSIDIDSYIDDEGYLNIESLSISTDSPERSDEVKDFLKKQTGFEVTVN